MPVGWFSGGDAALCVVVHSGVVQSNSSLPRAHAGDLAAACDAHLTCAREAPKRSGGVLDHRNVAGAVCAHCVPVRGMFMSSTAHENFLQYVALLMAARIFLGLQVAVFMLDINCQFSKHCTR